MDNNTFGWVKKAASDNARILQEDSDFQLAFGVNDLHEDSEAFVNAIESMEPVFRKQVLCARILKARKQLTVTVGHQRRSRIETLIDNLVETLKSID